MRECDEVNSVDTKQLYIGTGMFIIDLYNIVYVVIKQSLHPNTEFCVNVCCTVCNWVYNVVFNTLFCTTGFKETKETEQS